MVLDKYETLKDAIGSAKNMVNSRELVTESARELIEKEIQANQKTFDLEKMMEQMEL